MRKVTLPVIVMPLGILAVEMLVSKSGRSLENFDHYLEGVVRWRHFEHYFSRLLWSVVGIPDLMNSLETQTLRHALREEPRCVFLEHLQTVTQCEGLEAGIKSFASDYWAVLDRSIGWDSSVGIATRYELGGPGDRIPVGGGQVFCTCPDWSWGHTQPPIQWVPGLSRG